MGRHIKTLYTVNVTLPDSITATEANANVDSIDLGHTSQQWLQCQAETNERRRTKTRDRYRPHPQRHLDLPRSCLPALVRCPARPSQKWWPSRKRQSSLAPCSPQSAPSRMWRLGPTLNPRPADEWFSSVCQRIRRLHTPSTASAEFITVIGFIFSTYMCSWRF